MPSLACNNHQNDIGDAKYVDLKAQTASGGKISQCAFPRCSFKRSIPLLPPPPIPFVMAIQKPPTY